MSIERQLTDLFDEQAGRAPGPEGLFDATLRRARARRRSRMAATIGGMTALAAAVVLVAHVGLSGSATPTAGSTPTSRATGSVPAGLAGQPVADPRGSSGSCAYGYSPAIINQHLDFAFDGTVLAIGSPRTHDSGPVKWDYVPVTLAVNEWFKGGEAQTTTVFMPASEQSTATAASGEDSEGSPSEYPVGTRLLVSGTSQWDGGDPQYPVAVFGCGGFTRYYSHDTAASWRAAIS